MEAKLVFATAVAFCLCALCRGAPSAALPPFVYTGRITDYAGSGYEGVAKGAEIRARKAGRLIARAPVRASGGDSAANYTLVVPMSTVDGPAAAVKGDLLTFEIDAGTAGAADVFAATNAFAAVGNPGRVARVDIRVATSTRIPGVADQYLDDLAPYMAEYGYETYDPQADWDGDGVSNYEEFLAGTDPFNPDDAGLRILDWKPVAENDAVMALTFLPGRNRAYSAERRDPGSGSPFELRPHQTSPAPDAERKNYLLTGGEDPQPRTLYLLKEGAAALYRLRLD